MKGPATGRTQVVLSFVTPHREASLHVVGGQLNSSPHAIWDVNAHETPDPPVDRRRVRASCMDAAWLALDARICCSIAAVVLQNDWAAESRIAVCSVAERRDHCNRRDCAIHVSEGADGRLLGSAALHVPQEDLLL